MSYFASCSDLTNSFHVDFVLLHIHFNQIVQVKWTNIIVIVNLLHLNLHFHLHRRLHPQDKDSRLWNRPGTCRKCLYFRWIPTGSNVIPAGTHRKNSRNMAAVFRPEKNRTGKCTVSTFFPRPEMTRKYSDPKGNRVEPAARNRRYPSYPERENSDSGSLFVNLRELIVPLS